MDKKCGNTKGDLDVLFTQAIADLDNIPEDMVTTDYFEDQRYKRIYPDTEFDRGSAFSSCSSVGLKSYTRDQQKKIHELVDEFMSRI